MLLWSWVIGSVGGDNDEWEVRRAWRELGGVIGGTEVNVTRSTRKTLDLDAQRVPLDKTSYAFCESLHIQRTRRY